MAEEKNTIIPEGDERFYDDQGNLPSYIQDDLDSYFICFSESSAQEAIMYSEKLKDEFPFLKIKTNLGLESANSQFKKADKSGAKATLILGEEELKNNKISFKDLRTDTEQETLTLQELKNKLSKLFIN